MFKLMTLVVKKKGMSDDAFAKYMLEVHAALAKRMPGLSVRPTGNLSITPWQSCGSMTAKA
jgi:hypothetical protein